MRGKREEKKKLNYAKVFCVIIILAILIAGGIFAFNKMNSPKQEEIIAKEQYFLCFTNNKWGVINQKGDIVIEPTYDDMIVIPDNTKGIFVCYTQVDYAAKTFVTKVLDSTGHEILATYQNVEPIVDAKEESGFSATRLTYIKDGKYGLLDLEGNSIVEAIYETPDAAMAANVESPQDTLNAKTGEELKQQLGEFTLKNHGTFSYYSK